MARGKFIYLEKNRVYTGKDSTVAGFVEITFPDVHEDHAAHSAVVSITSDIAGLLSDNGWNSADFNKVTWPIGAGSYGTGRFLLSSKTLELLSDFASTIDPTEEEDEAYNLPLQINFNGLLFDRMHMLPAVPVLNPTQEQSADAPQFFVVDFVDERYWWQKHFMEVGELVVDPEGEEEIIGGTFRHGLNMMNVHLGELDEDTLFKQIDDDGNSFRFPWKLRDVLNVMLGEHSGDGYQVGGEFQFLPDVNEWGYFDSPHLYNYLDIIDVHKTGKPFGEFLDTICTLSGAVLIAYPNTSVSELVGDVNENESGEIFGVRYRIAPLADQRSITFRESVSDGIISGGMLPAIEPTGVNVVADLNMGLPDYAIQSQVPHSVIVHFPRIYKGSRPLELFEDPETDPTINNYTTLDISNGRPAVWAHNRPANMYSSVYAVYEYIPEDLEADPPQPNEMKWVNEETCNEYAVIASRRYYDRFRSGPLDMLLVDTYGSDGYGGGMYLWPGCQTIEWALTDQGPTTRLSGTYHHPLFGFSASNELGRDNLQTTSAVKSIVRPDGSVVYQLPTVDLRHTLYHARITSVEDPLHDYGPGYRAKAVTDESIEWMIDRARTIRSHDINAVDIVPLSVGDYCIIGMGYRDEEGGQSSSYSSSTQGDLLRSKLIGNTGDAQSSSNPFRALRGGTSESDYGPVALYVFEKPKTVQCSDVSTVAATGGFYGSLPTTTGRY